MKCNIVEVFQCFRFVAPLIRVVCQLPIGNFVKLNFDAAIYKDLNCIFMAIFVMRASIVLDVSVCSRMGREQSS